MIGITAPFRPRQERDLAAALTLALGPAAAEGWLGQETLLLTDDDGLLVAVVLACLGARLQVAGPLPTFQPERDAPGLSSLVWRMRQGWEERSVDPHPALELLGHGSPERVLRAELRQPHELLKGGARYDRVVITGQAGSRVGSPHQLLLTARDLLAPGGRAVLWLGPAQASAVVETLELSGLSLVARAEDVEGRLLVLAAEPVPPLGYPALSHGEPEEWAETRARYGWLGPLCAGRRVLELGCRGGVGSRLLAQAGAEVTALDDDPDAVAAAELIPSEGSGGVRYQRAMPGDPLQLEPAEFGLGVAVSPGSPWTVAARGPLLEQLLRLPALALAVAPADLPRVEATCAEAGRQVQRFALRRLSCAIALPTAQGPVAGALEPWRPGAELPAAVAEAGAEVLLLILDPEAGLPAPAPAAFWSGSSREAALSAELERTRGQLRRVEAERFEINNLAAWRRLSAPLLGAVLVRKGLLWRLR